ncbi:hypothetical protein ACPV5L_18150 [Vibrio astriarenae]
MKHPDKMIKTALAATVASAAALASTPALAKQPNIVAIMVDDVAPMDISAYHRGLGQSKHPTSIESPSAVL